MSVVMKALTAKRSAEKQQAAAGASGSAVVGVQVGSPSGSEPPKSPRAKLWTKRAGLLLVLLLLIAGGVGGIMLYQQHGFPIESIQLRVSQWLGMASKAPVQTEVPLVQDVVAPPVEKTTADLTQEARNLFANQHVDESLKRFQDLVAQHPEDVLLHNDLAMVFIKKELYSSAAEHLSRALEINPECAVCYGNLGYLKSLLQEHVEAETYLKKAIRLKPDEATFHFNLAVLYEKNGDLGGGAQQYQLFLDLSPDQNTDLVQKVRDRIYALTGQ